MAKFPKVLSSLAQEVTKEVTLSMRRPMQPLFHLLKITLVQSGPGVQGFRSPGDQIVLVVNKLTRQMKSLEDWRSESTCLATRERFEDLFLALVSDAFLGGGVGAGPGGGTSVLSAGLEEVTNMVTDLEGQVNQLTQSVGDLDKENATMVSVGTQEF